MWQRTVRFAATLGLAAIAGATRAAHPLISEDTGTQGAGHVELELGVQRSSVAGGHALELDPQLSYGAHALAMVPWNQAGAPATANIAYVRLPRDFAGGASTRRDTLRVSAAYLQEVHKDVRLAIEGAVYRDPDPALAAWPAVVLIGAIAHLPIGVDVDVGYQARGSRAAPAGVWLAGMTLRW